MDILNTCIAMVGVVVLIIGFRVNAVISLLLGCLYIGLTTGLGVEGTLTTITAGFGEIMAEIGLLIGFGVLIGSILSAIGTVQRLTELLLRVFGPRRFPYAMAVSTSTVLPSIFADVQVVLAAPLVRTAAPKLGKYGLGLVAGAQAAGMLASFVFVVPGAVVVSVAGLIGAPLGTMLLWGFIIGPVTAFITVVIWAGLIRMGFWNPDKDELRSTPTLPDGTPETDSDGGEQSGGGGGVAVAVRKRTLPLTLTLLPVIVPLLMIASTSITTAAGIESTALAWIGNPTLALFVGLAIAYVLGRYQLGRRALDKVFGEGLNTIGHVLLITGVGGSLGAVITSTDMKDVLAGVFAAQAGASVVFALLITYLVAALIHLLIGSISVAAITTAGIIAPVLGSIDVNPAFVAFTICAGVLFAVHVNSNAFWMFASLMRLTTSGALKALSLITCIVSVVSLPMILALAVLS